MGRLTSKVVPQDRQRYSYRGMAHSISPPPGTAAGRDGGSGVTAGWA